MSPGMSEVQRERLRRATPKRRGCLRRAAGRTPSSTHRQVVDSASRWHERAPRTETLHPTSWHRGSSANSTPHSTDSILACRQTIACCVSRADRQRLAFPGIGSANAARHDLDRREQVPLPGRHRQTVHRRPLEKGRHQVLRRVGSASSARRSSRAGPRGTGARGLTGTPPTRRRYRAPTQAQQRCLARKRCCRRRIRLHEGREVRAPCQLRGEVGIPALLPRDLPRDQE